MNRLVTSLILGLIALFVLLSTVFVVDQRQYAIVFALGEVKQVINQPGLHFKLPPPFQNVLFLDKRILTIDSARDRSFHHGRKEEHSGRYLRQMAYHRSPALFRQFRR